MSDLNSRLMTLLPAWQWLRKYNQAKFKSDLLSAFIVIAMLVPQGMAYAMLAGLPPIMGLYASILTGFYGWCDFIIVRSVKIWLSHSTH